MAATIDTMVRDLTLELAHTYGVVCDDDFETVACDPEQGAVVAYPIETGAPILVRIERLRECHRCGEYPWVVADGLACRCGMWPRWS